VDRIIGALPLTTVLSTRHDASTLAGSFDRNEPVHGLVIGILASRHLATGFVQLKLTTVQSRGRLATGDVAERTTGWR